MDCRLHSWTAVVKAGTLAAHRWGRHQVRGGQLRWHSPLAAGECSHGRAPIKRIPGDRLRPQSEVGKRRARASRGTQTDTPIRRGRKQL